MKEPTLQILPIDFPEANKILYDTGKQEGRKEVIDWIKEVDIGDESCVVISIDDWDAKMKEIK